jgi:hypothetical protein
MWSAAMHYVLFYEVRNDYVENERSFANCISSWRARRMIAVN